jgi:hypothetical protein
VCWEGTIWDMKDAGCWCTVPYSKPTPFTEVTFLLNPYVVKQQCINARPYGHNRVRRTKDTWNMVIYVLVINKDENSCVGIHGMMSMLQLKWSRWLNSVHCMTEGSSRRCSEEKGDLWLICLLHVCIHILVWYCDGLRLHLTSIHTRSFFFLLKKGSWHLTREMFAFDGLLLVILFAPLNN